MKKLHPLLIGSPISYKLVDFELLKKNNIEPVMAYQKQMHSIGEGSSVFYNSLDIDEIGRIIDARKIDAIVCFNDNFLIEAALLRKKYNIMGISYPDIQKYKIKSEMYKCLNPYISVPKTICIYENLKFEEIIKLLGEGEYFIKPDNLAGSEGGRHIKSSKDYVKWMTKHYKSGEKYIIQKYYSSPLYHCELIVKNNEIRYIQARRYSYPNHMFLVGKIIASFPITDLSLKVKIEQAAVRVQQILGYTNGVMHTEFFLENGRDVVFLETNIRQAGGAINLIHKRRAGISFETAMVLLELDKDIVVALNNPDFYDFCGYIPIKKGEVIEICSPKLKGHYNFDFRVQVGAHYDAPQSASNTAVAFVGYSYEYMDLIDNFLYLENNDIIKYN